MSCSCLGGEEPAVYALYHVYCRMMLAGFFVLETGAVCTMCTVIL